MIVSKVIYVVLEVSGYWTCLSFRCKRALVVKSALTINYCYLLIENTNCMNTVAAFCLSEVSTFKILGFLCFVCHYLMGIFIIIQLIFQ